MDHSNAAADLALQLADADDDDVDTIITTALHDLAATVSADRAYITLYHDDGTFENSHEWTAAHVVPQLPAIQRLAAADFAYSYGAALRGEVLAVPDVSKLPDAARAEHRSFSSFGVHAVLQVPIAIGGRGIGLVGINHFGVVDGWSDEFVDTVASVGRVLGVVIHRHRSATSARVALEDLVRANRLKEQLLDQLGHELRTPLHAILGYSELLELDDRPDDERDALLQIQFHGRHLLTLIEGLVALAHAGDSPTNDVELSPLVASVVDELRPVAARRRIDVAVNEQLAGSCVRGEAGRLRQVVYCVVSGAVQGLAPGSSVRIDASPTADLVVDMRSSAGSLGDDVVMPLARTLLDGHGTLSTVERADGSVSIEILVGSPTAQTAMP